MCCEFMGDVLIYRSRGFEDFMNKSSESYKVYLEKSEAHAGGVCGTQPDGLSRALPKAQEVKTAVEEKGAADRCAKKQTGENRFPINSHEAEHKTHGPNN